MSRQTETQWRDRQDQNYALFDSTLGFVLACLLTNETIASLDTAAGPWIHWADISF